MCRASRRRRWRGKVFGDFLQQRWHAAGGSWRVREVVATDEIIGYRGKRRLRTYQGVEGDEASSVVKSVGLGGRRRWESLTGVRPADREIWSGTKASTWGKWERAGMSGWSTKSWGVEGVLIASVQVTCHRQNRR
jgi:hypothetical protein